MTTAIEQLFADKRQDIGSLCASLNVRELRVFGSAVSGRFDPLHSDIDVLVDFYDPEAPGHGYDNVDDAIVWDILTRKLPILATEVGSLVDFWRPEAG